MIRNEQELKTTQERIAYFHELLAQFRVSATAESSPRLRAAIVQKSSACRTRCWST
jgi:hypothetical protein